MFRIANQINDMDNRLVLTRQQREYFLPKAYNAAVRAGEIILDIYSRKQDYDINLKSDNTPITLADRLSHSLIKEYLAQTRIPLLSEEGRQMLFDERKDWDMFWMVDPLDGTKEFIKGNNEFTVNIALMVSSRPAIGVIYVPYYRKMYFCEKGFGSFFKEDVAPDRTAEFTYEEIYDSARELPLVQCCNSPIRVGVSRSHKNELTMRYIDELRRDHPDLQIVEQGSSYKFCMLAEGSIDYYVRTSDTYEWDTAAGEVILSETGGTTKTLPEQAKFAYNKESLLNPHFICRNRFVVK